MSLLPPIEYEDASPAVRAVYDDIRATRKTTSINSFWRTLANDPDLLRAKWEAVKVVMKDGQLDSLTKELLYVAVSICHANQYAMRTHVAAARNKGMTDAMYAELVAVVHLAAGNVALIDAYAIDLEPQMQTPSAPTR